MPATAIKQGQSTGHGCFPPTAAIGAFAVKTFVTGKECQLTGVTIYQSHSCGTTTHSGGARKVSSGSSKVFIEGKPAVRIGDSIACGDKVAGGNPKVFMG